MPAAYSDFDSHRVEEGPRASRNIVLETLERLWELIPSPGSVDASSRETQCHLPQTTRARRRESIAETSLDKDEALVEKVPSAAVSIAQPDESIPHEKSVLYLAYGSNLAAETFLGKRGIKPLSQINVVVPDLKLTFDLPGLPYVEPCFAATRYRHTATDEYHDEEDIDDNAMDIKTSEKTPLSSHRESSPADRPLVGVVYEVTVTDYARIIATEGGGGGYKDIVIDCYPFPDSYNPTDPVPDNPTTTPFKAHTLLAPVEEADGGQAQRLLSRVYRPFLSRSNPLVRPHPLGYAQPSPRYLNLIVTGAAEHNLPVSYQKYLSQIRPYRATTVRQLIGKVVFMVVWGPFLLLTLAMTRTLGGPDGRSPPWVIKFADLVFFTMWSSYDMAFARIFGDGERTVER